ncbi:MAG: hypothetical protein AAGA90_19800 [Actinomycetota bacterium]
MRQLIVIIAIALAAAACGDDSGGSADPRAAELSEVLEADTALALTGDEAECTAGGIVDALDDASIETLLAADGLELGDLAGPAEAIAAFDAYLDCVDVEQKMVDSLLATGTEADTARCVAESFGEDELRTMLGASALPGGAVDEEAAFNLVGEVFQAAQACVDG